MGHACKASRRHNYKVLQHYKMTQLVQTMVCLAVLCCTVILGVSSQCTIKEGLPCGSKEKLVSGSSFTISSKTCQNGLYPKREQCGWYFEVDGCKPSLNCNKMALKAKGKKMQRRQTKSGDRKSQKGLLSKGAIEKWV